MVTIHSIHRLSWVKIHKISTITEMKIKWRELQQRVLFLLTFYLTLNSKWLISILAFNSDNGGKGREWVAPVF